MNELVKLYAENCKHPITAYQFLKLSDFGMIETYVNNRFNTLKNIDLVESPKMDLRDYEYHYLTDIQKIEYIKQHHKNSGLSNEKYKDSSDNVKIVYVKTVRLLGEDNIKNSSNRVLHVYIDSLEQNGPKGNLGEILKTIENPENMIYYIYNKKYKGFENSILDKINTILSKTKHPDKLIAILDKLLEQSGWESKVMSGGCVGWLEKQGIAEILIKSVNPKNIFNLLTETQKQTWYNIYSTQRHIFISLAGSRNSAEIFNIFGEDAVKAFIRQLKMDISSDDEKILLWAIDKIFKSSKEFNVKISQNYLRPIYKAIINSKLSFKILNLLKENGYWHYFQKFTNDESELGAEMGSLGF